MPKILRIINRLNLGGPTYNAAYLTKYLAPEFETMLVAGVRLGSEESSEFIVQSMGINPVYIPEMHRELSLINDFAAYRKIKSILRDFKPDIVHTHAAKAGTLGRLAAIACKTPVILHTFHGHVFHSYFSPAKTRLFIQIEKYLASRSSAIIAISEMQKDDLCNRFRICKPEKCEVIPLGFDLERFALNREINRKEFRDQFGIGNHETAIGIIGRLTAIKNHKMFVRCFADVKKRTNKNIRAVIIGDGEELQHIMELCTENNLNFSTIQKPQAGAPVVFTSWIRDIECALAGLDIVALTSLNEGTPVSLIEAQAAGKPVVSVAAGGTSNAVNHGETGLVSPVNDSEKFSEHLLRLVEDPALCRKFGDAGELFVQSKFNYSRLVDDIRNLYFRLLKTKR